MAVAQDADRELDGPDPIRVGIAAEWDPVLGPWQEVDGTLCFVDISGLHRIFRAACPPGRIGAEELTEVLNRVFGSMLELATTVAAAC